MSRRDSASEIVPIDLPELQAEQLRVFTEIGQGRFKSVSFGCYSRRGNAAILRYKANNNANEVYILSHLMKHDSSSHAVQTYGFMKDAGTLVVAQEFASFGSVKSVLQDPELIPKVTPKHKLHIAAQFARAASFLASVRLIHTDFACRNFLVFALDAEPEHTNVKVTDFMHSLILPPQTDRLRRKLPQASRWCAPETVTFNEWSYKSEVWSLGVTIWELFNTCELPWRKYSKRADVVQKLKELAWSLNEGSPPNDSVMALDFPPPAALSTSTHASLLSCLRPDANARPSCKQIEAVFEQLVGPSSTSQKSSSPVVPDAKVQPSVQSSRKVLPISAVLPHEKAQPSAQISRKVLPISAMTQNGDRTQATIVKPLPRSSTPAKEVDLGASDLRAETPSTRCPTALSTPRLTAVYRSDASASGYPGSATFSYERYATPDSVSRLSQSAPCQSESTQQFQKLLWYTPSWPKKEDSLSNVRAFLSSPEAVCGLGIKNQVRLRAHLAAAENARSELATSTLVV
jgi:serine/threonine protein kinase